MKIFNFSSLCMGAVRAAAIDNGEDFQATVVMLTAPRPRTQPFLCCLWICTFCRDFDPYLQAYSNLLLWYCFLGRFHCHGTWLVFYCSFFGCWIWFIYKVLVKKIMPLKLMAERHVTERHVIVYIGALPIRCTKDYCGTPCNTNL